MRQADILGNCSGAGLTGSAALLEAPVVGGAGAALLALGPVTAAAQVVSREAARELFGSG